MDELKPQSKTEDEKEIVECPVKECGKGWLSAVEWTVELMLRRAEGGLRE